MNRTKFHGITSISWVAVAIVIAAVTAFLASRVLAIVYLVVCVVALTSVLFAYCAKCPCRTHCSHVFPGKLAALLARQPGPYTSIEVAALVVAFILLLGLPQAWLWRTPLWLVVFWLLNAVAVVQIRRAVCPGCDNVYCPLRVGG